MNSFPNSRHAARRAFVASAILLFLSILQLGCESQSPEDFVARAEKFIAAGDLRTAVIELKSGLQRFPENAYGRVVLGRIYLRVRDGQSAEKEFLRAIQAGAAESGVRAYLGEAYELQGKWDEALDLPVGESLALEDRASLHVTRGYAYLAQQQAVAAGQEFDAAALLEPQAAAPLVGKAGISLLADDRVGALKLLDEALDLDPTFARAWRLRADMAWADGDLAAAEAAYSKAVEFDPMPEESRMRLLLVRLEAGKWEQVEHDVGELKRTLSKNPHLLHAQGMLKFHKREFGEASLLFEEALALEPSLANTLYFAGVSHLNQGNLELALSYLERFVTKRPQSEFGRLALGLVQLRLRAFDSALATVEPVLAGKPDHSLALNIKAHAVMGDSGETDLANSLLGGPTHGAETVVSAGPEVSAAAVLSLQADVVRGAEPVTSEKFDQALQAALDFQEKHPEVANANAAVGALYLMRGDRDQARMAFDKALAIDPANQTANGGLAALAVLAGDPDVARIHYQAILAAHPRDMKTALNLAALEASEGNDAAMLTVVDQALRDNPESVEPALWLGRYHLKQGHPRTALPILAEAIKRHSENDVLALFYARVLIAAGEFSEAEEKLATIVSRHPKAAPGLYLRGKAEQGLGKLDAAVASYQQALELNPAIHEARYDLIRAALSLGKIVLAEGQMATLTSRVGESPDLLLLQAKVADAKGDRATVVEKLGRRFELERNNLNLAAYASARSEHGESREALVDLERWLEEFPQDGLILLQMADILMALGESERAVAAYERVLETKNVNPVPALNNLAWLLLDSVPAKALEYATEVKRRAPASWAATDTLSIVWLANGDPVKALALNDEVFAADASNPEVRYHRAQILTALQRNDEARPLLEALVADGASSFRGKSDAETLLRALD